MARLFHLNGTVETVKINHTVRETNEFIYGVSRVIKTDVKWYLVSRNTAISKRNVNVLASNIVGRLIYGSCLELPKKYVSKKIPAYYLNTFRKISITTIKKQSE